MHVNLASLLDGGAIIFGSTVTSKKGAIEALAAALAEVTDLKARDIADAAMERERLGSTGVGEGVAIPHARLEGLSQPIGALLLARNGIDFEAIDDRECDLIFMLLAPNTDGADHLRALAQVSRIFRQADIRQALRNAGSEAEVRDILCQEATA